MKKSPNNVIKNESNANTEIKDNKNEGDSKGKVFILKN